MIKGILVINHFLKSDKFEELYESFKKSAYELKIKLSVFTNRELMFDSTNSLKLSKDTDFILFWDKDILLAKHLENLGFRVFNSSSAIEMCDDKAFMHVMLRSHNISCPRTIIPPFTFEGKWDIKSDLVDNYIEDIIKELSFPMIIKARKGSFGAQVHLVHSKNELINVLKMYGANDILFQEYIEYSEGRDMRLQVVGDNVVASMYRYSKNDFRANISNGGSMKEIQPDAKAKELAIRASKALGLDFAGVDILFDKENDYAICELNSNAHFVNIYNCTGVNVSYKILEYIKGKC